MQQKGRDGRKGIQPKKMRRVTYRNKNKIERKIYIGAKKATMRRDLVRRGPGVRGEERKPSKEIQEMSCFEELSVLPRMQRKSGRNISSVSGRKSCAPFKQRVNLFFTEISKFDYTLIYNVTPNIRKIASRRKMSLMN